MNNQREHRLRFFAAILLTAAIAFSFGLYVASSIIGDHVKQETRRADRIR